MEEKRECTACKSVDLIAFSLPRTDHTLHCAGHGRFDLFLSFSLVFSSSSFLFLSLHLLLRLALSYSDHLPPLSPYRRTDRKKEERGGRRPEKRGKTRTRSERESCRGLGDKLIVDVRHAPPPPLTLSLSFSLSLVRPTDRQTSRPNDTLTPKCQSVGAADTTCRVELNG